MRYRNSTSVVRVLPRVLLLLALVAGWCVAIAAAPSTQAQAASDPVIAIGGDIACPPGATVTATSCGQGKTGALLSSINPNYVLPLGDTQYDSGTPTEYAGSYNVTGWGTDKGISRPAIGNHEYRTTGASGYYGYFGSNAGDPAKGYYSWDITGPNNAFRWHLISLNSECTQLGNGSIPAGCGAGSPQETWLKSDLAANKGVCTIAYWHRPQFSSSTSTPSSTSYTAFWNDLYAAGADIVLNGHAHDYERFAPQTSSGAPDAAKGLTEFIAGTGGENFQNMGAGIANSVVRNASAFGVLKMTLHASTYDWQFVAASGYSLTDTGTGTCHSAPPPDTTPPSAPTNVNASAPTPNAVNLNWSASSDNVGVANYAIYRGANGATPSQIAVTTNNSTSYTDSAVSASTTYTYQVQAIDGAGNKSPLSGVATVTTPATADTTPPTAPGSLQAENVAYNEIDIGWSASTDSGTGVSGYHVYRKGPGESVYTLLATTTGNGAGSTSYADTTVKQSSTYNYYVTAFDGANNESLPSGTTTENTPAGPTSSTYTFTASGDATIQQAYPTTTGGSTSPLVVDNSPVEDALLQFNVSTSGCDTLTSATLTLTDNTDGSVKGGDVYTTGPFTESTVTWSTAPTRGTLLNSIGAVASNAVVKVDVTKGAALNGVVNFRIGTTSSDGVHYFSREASSGKPTLTVVCSAAPNPDNTPPTAPSNLQGNPTAGEIDLSWTAATDNVAVTEYHVYRGGTQIGIVPASSLTYQDTTVAPTTSYTYTVKSFDAAGNASPDSNAVMLTSQAAPPAAPTNLTATPTSSTSVTLNWTASTSPSVTGYNVYRGPHGGALTLIGSPGNAPFTDTVATAGTTYDYAVTAVATGGTESAKSNIVTVTTPGQGGGGGGGGVTLRNAVTTPVATAGTSWTVNLPTYSPGDLVVVWVANNLGSTAGTPTASGWASQLVTNESSGLKGSFLTRTMVSGDPTSITVTFSSSTSGVAEAAAFTGVSATSPVDVKAGQAEASTTAVATHSTPSVTTTASDVLIAGFTTDKAATWTASGSEPGTEIADVTVGSLSAALYYSTAPVAVGSHVQSATATVASVKAVSSVLALRVG